MPKPATAEEHPTTDFSIAVAIPCLNEAATIASVVEDFHAALGGARVYVYDNASTDDTINVAAAAGAIIRHEPERGKGNVVRRVFGDLDADIVVLVDGDGTYPAHEARRMIGTLVVDRLDMVVGARLPVQQAAYPRGHRLGNRLITAVVGAMFGRRFRDILSGYRVLSRRFAKSFPAQARGFEVETEMAVHALAMGMPATEVDVPYAGRPPGSHSKLRTVPDGIAIARTIMVLVKEEKPLALFALAGGVLLLLAVALAWPLLPEYFETGLVPRLPTAILSTGLALLGALSFGCGLVLDTVTRSRRESRRLHYLALPTPRDAARPAE